jgi:hypothetical protein
MSPLAYPVLIGAALVIGFILVVRRLRDRAFFDVLEAVGRDNVVLIDSAANCLGLGSRGPASIHGNGCLCLTPTSVVFQRWIPRQQIEIPRRDIRDIDDPSAFLGRERGKRLLRIHFSDATGQPDTIAFSVQDVTTWLKAFSGPR